jgi:predicted HTH transcriptional regulator
MIAEGEHQRQDFKYCINDSRKIAVSLVAFANTDGGRLLLGIRDNGSVAGVVSEEEYYMAEAAARLYSKPPIPFHIQVWKAEGKTLSWEAPLLYAK